MMSKTIFLTTLILPFSPRLLEQCNDVERNPGPRQPQPRGNPDRPQPRVNSERQIQQRGNPEGQMQPRGNPGSSGYHSSSASSTNSFGRGGNVAATTTTTTTTQRASSLLGGNNQTNLLLEGRADRIGKETFTPESQIQVSCNDLAEKLLWSG